jgi:hypothetical protein
MTVALYAVTKLTGPLHRLTGWLTNNTAPRPVPAIKQATACRPKAPEKSRLQTLRIERIVESGQCGNQAGRMVISGRMADVCAELDRLVARDAALH